MHEVKSSQTPIVAGALAVPVGLILNYAGFASGRFGEPNTGLVVLGGAVAIAGLVILLVGVARLAANVDFLARVTMRQEAALAFNAPPAAPPVEPAEPVDPPE